MSTPVSDKFSISFAEVPVVQCWVCRHAGDGNHCVAFPGGIPDDIRANQADHRRPWIDPETGEPGDMGIPLERSITFEPAEGVDPAVLGRLYEHLDSLPR